MLAFVLFYLEIITTCDVCLTMQPDIIMVTVFFEYCLIKISPTWVTRHVSNRQPKIVLEAATRGVLLEKVFLRNSAKFTGKHLCQSLFFNKVASLSPAPFWTPPSDCFCVENSCNWYTAIVLKQFFWTILSSKKKFPANVYLWTYIVITRLYIAIIKWIYKIKSVRKFTKIWLFQSYFSIIFYSFFEERLCVDQVFFTKATWNSSINPNSLPVNLSCQIRSTFKSIKSKLLS